MQINADLTLYKAGLSSLSHEINNILQEAVYSLEKIASLGENSPSINKKHMNALVFKLTKNIYAIRDICFGYANLDALPVLKHTKLIENIYGRTIDISGSVEDLSVAMSTVVSIYMYVIAKANNIKLLIEKDKTIIGPCKKSINFLPSQATNLGQLINFFAESLSIRADEDCIEITESTQKL